MASAPFRQRAAATAANNAPLQGATHGDLHWRVRDRRLLPAATAAAILVLFILTYRVFASGAQSDADRRAAATAAVTAQAVAQAVSADALLAAGVAGADGVADLVRGTASQPTMSAVEYAALNVERANPSVQGLYFYDRRGVYVVGQIADSSRRPPAQLGVTCDPSGAFCTDTNAPTGGYLSSTALRTAMSRLLRTGVAPLPALAFDRSTGPYGSLFILRPVVAPGRSDVLGCLLERVDAAGILRPYVAAPSAPSLILRDNVVLGADATRYHDRNQVPVMRSTSDVSRDLGLAQAPVPYSLVGAYPRFILHGTAMSGSVAAVPGTDLRVVSYVPAPPLSGPTQLLLIALGVTFLLSLAAFVVPFLESLVARVSPRPAALDPSTSTAAAASSPAARRGPAAPRPESPPALPVQRAASAAPWGPTPPVGGASVWSVREAIAADFPRAVPEWYGPDDSSAARPSAAPAPPSVAGESLAGEIDRRTLDRPPRLPGLIPTLLRRRNRQALPASAPAESTSARGAAQVPSDGVGDRVVDVALRALVERFTAAFPARMRACYVYGSHADGSGVGGSDVDLAIVFAGSWRNAAERDAAEGLLAHCAGQSPIELDGEVLAEVELGDGVFPDLKLGSRLVYGTDFRDQLVLLPIEEWTRNRMHAAYFLIATRFNRRGSVALPLGYPDPAGPLYGYDSRPMRLPDGTAAPSTRDLIRVASWSATALVALKAGEYVARKRESHLLYRRFIGDEWSDFLDDLFTICRGEWRYLIPEREDERLRLRALCETMLGFENHVLGIYRDYLQGELEVAAGAYAERLIALLDHAPFHDPAIAAPLRALRVRVGRSQGRRTDPDV